MEVGSVNNYSTTVQSTSSGQTLGENEFFQILSAQLQYQDPMDGGDNSEYVAQLAQFSSLEQMKNLNIAIGDLKSNQNLLLGTNLIGKTVILNGENGSESGVVQSVRLRESDLFVLVDDCEYPSSCILDISGAEDENANRIIDGIDQVSERLDSILAQESTETNEIILEGE